MSLAREQAPGRLVRAEELERAFLSCVDAAEDDLQRTECFDEEQRAEIHAILEALKHDGQSQAGMLHVLQGEYRHA